MVPVVVTSKRERQQAVQLLCECCLDGKVGLAGVVHDVLVPGRVLQLLPNVAAVLALFVKGVCEFLARLAKIALLVVPRKCRHGREVRPCHSRLQIAVRLALLLGVEELLGRRCGRGRHPLLEAQALLEQLVLVFQRGLIPYVFSRGCDRAVVHEVSNRQQFLGVLDAVVIFQAWVFALRHVRVVRGGLNVRDEARAQRPVDALHPVLVIGLEHRAVKAAGGQRPDCLKEVHRVRRRQAARLVCQRLAIVARLVRRVLVAPKVAHVLVHDKQRQDERAERRRNVQHVGYQQPKIGVLTLQPPIPTRLERPDLGDVGAPSLACPRLGS